MRHGLKGARLVLTPNGQSQFGSPCVGLFDQLFLAVVSGSLTRTTPCLRLRIATPGSHQVRLFCQLRPGSCSVRKGADLGQPVWSLAQGSLQQAQGPGGRAVRVALGRSCPFRQNALLRVSAIADPRSAPVARSHGSQPVAVEAADPGGDGLGVPSSDLVGRRRVASPISNGQQNSGALDLRGGSAERTAQAGQLLALIRGERAQGVFLVARHGTPRVTRITPPLYHISRKVTH